MTQVSMKALLETGVHFGHRTRKWHPRMGPYIFTERNGIHILDLHQTLQAIQASYDLVVNTVSNGGTVLFVGTKRQAQETIAREAARCGMPYVNERWLGGTLTNWRTIRQRIDHLKNLEARRERGEFELLTKKEGLMLERQIENLLMRIGGIRDMQKLPALLFIVDVRREHTAIREANILELPVLAMVDTNCDPSAVDYVIPSNDDAIRAIKLITSVVADAVLEGLAIRGEDAGEMEEPTMAYDYDYEVEIDAEEDEVLLGEATLAKLKDQTLHFDDEDEEEEIEVEDEVVVDSPEEDALADEIESAVDEEGGEEEAADEE